MLLMMAKSIEVDFLELKPRSTPEVNLTDYILANGAVCINGCPAHV